MRFKFKLFTLGFLVGLGLIFLASDSFAAVFFDQTPPPGSNQVSTDLCGGPVVCANSYNVNNCGLPDCSGGLDWTKYTLTCVESDNPADPYDSYYQETAEKICSIGDKCILGSQGLNAGFCDCSYGTAQYKVCCSNGTSNVCENSPSILQDGTFPPEGQCPSGTTEQFCGFDPYPPCDSACGAPRQCNQLNRTYNQCCGIGLSQQVQEYVWDDGSGEVCNYISGACNQVDSSCGGSYNTSCTNLSVAQGSSGTSNVTLTLASGTVPSVGSFAVSGLPSGASASFSPTSCTPNCSTTMTISTTSSTSAGNYIISVNGSPSAAAKNTCTLTIPPPPGCTLPAVDMKANSSNGPVDIANNTSANLSWTAGNSPTSCTASGAWSGSKSVTGGSQSTGNLAGPNSYNYTLSCSNSCGSNSDSVTVNVSPSSGCSFGSPSNPNGIFPNPVPYNSSTSTYSNTQISWTTSGSGGSNIYYYNPGTCTLSSCPTSGWTLITNAPYDSSWDYVWNPNPFFPAQGSTHTIGITGTNNVLCSVKDVSFGTGSTPPPASSSCTGISGPNTLLLQGGKATGTYDANFQGDATNLVFHWSDNQGASDDTPDQSVTWNFYSTGTKTLSATYTNAGGSGSCGSKTVEVELPANICNGFSITDQYPPINPGDNIAIKPLVDWTNVSKVNVRYYEDPQPLSPPFTENKWKSLGIVDGVKTGCVEYEDTEDGPACIKYTQGEAQWNLPSYPGRWYIGMEVYDKAGAKVAGWNTGDTTGCTQIVNIQPRSDYTCDTDQPVFPANIKVYSEDNDVLLKWEITNTDRLNDTSTAYRSSQNGFTASGTPLISKFSTDYTSFYDEDSAQTILTYGAHIVENLSSGSYFYKIAAFNQGGEFDLSKQLVSSAQTRKIDVPREQSNQCSNFYSPPNPSNFKIEAGTSFGWEYNNSFISLSGWYLNGPNGLKYDIPTNKITLRSNCRGYWYLTCANYLPPYPLPAGQYSIQAWGGNCGDIIGQASNTANYSSSPSPTSPPAETGTSPSARAGSNYGSVDVSWRPPPSGVSRCTEYDEDGNCIRLASALDGFHVYQSTTALDLTKSSTPPSGTDSYSHSAYFPDLPVGTHYFAVYNTNNCGNGWSDVVEVNLQLQIKPWIKTTGGDVHSNIRINTPGGP